MHFRYVKLPSGVQLLRLVGDLDGIQAAEEGKCACRKGHTCQACTKGRMTLRAMVAKLSEGLTTRAILMVCTEKEGEAPVLPPCAVADVCSPLLAVIAPIAPAYEHLVQGWLGIDPATAFFTIDTMRMYDKRFPHVMCHKDWHSAPISVVQSEKFFSPLTGPQFASRCEVTEMLAATRERKFAMVRLPGDLDNGALMPSEADHDCKKCEWGPIPLTDVIDKLGRQEGNVLLFVTRGEDEEAPRFPSVLPKIASASVAVMLGATSAHMERFVELLRKQTPAAALDTARGWKAEEGAPRVIVNTKWMKSKWTNEKFPITTKRNAKK